MPSWDRLMKKIAADSKYCLGTKIVQKYHFMYNPRLGVHLIDTPGFDDSSDDVFKDIGRFMGKSHLHEAKLSGVLFLYNVTVSNFSFDNFSILANRGVKLAAFVARLCVISLCSFI